MDILTSEPSLNPDITIQSEDIDISVALAQHSPAFPQKNIEEKVAASKIPLKDLLQFYLLVPASHNIFISIFPKPLFALAFRYSSFIFLIFGSIHCLFSLFFGYSYLIVWSVLGRSRTCFLA